MDKKVVLSICVPTYNRRARIVALVADILSLPGPFEVCVHDDGSRDDTALALARFCDERLSVTRDSNRGRAAALLKCIERSSGDYCMLFDDDDLINLKTLAQAITRCSMSFPIEIGGMIYLMNDDERKTLGARFRSTRSNFLRLRADEGISGDKKEIVRTLLLKSAVSDFRNIWRRVPSSLAWSRIALTYDCLCFNEDMGTKRYFPEGMTAKIAAIKRENTYPMYLLYRTRAVAFFRRRYRSGWYFIRSVVGLAYYRILSLIS